MLPLTSEKLWTVALLWKQQIEIEQNKKDDKEILIADR